MSALATHSGQPNGGEKPPSGLSPDTVALACLCPPQNVRAHWPLIVDALKAEGIGDLLVQIAAAATIATETGSFKPIVEKMADPERQPDLAKSQARYFPYIGRGFIQLTWEANYRCYGNLVDVDLISDPQAACVPVVAAKIFASYFNHSGAAAAARVEDWRRVRKIVNGGLNGWDRFHSCILALLEAES